MRRSTLSLFAVMLAITTIVYLLWTRNYEPPARSIEPTAVRPAPDRSSSIKSFIDYSVSVQKFSEVTMCEVTFNSMPPTADIAAGIVRSAVEKLVKEDGSREILAMAFNSSGDSLSKTYYGGAITYLPSDGKILTMDERNGLQSTESDEGIYHVLIEDRSTLRGITPARRWYNVSIIFSNKPSGTEIKTAVLKEIKKLKPHGLDVHVYIYKGEKSNKITWKQSRAPNNKYMAIDYVAKTGDISPNWDWN